MHSGISGGKIYQTPGYGNRDEDGGPLPFFRWLVLVTDLGVHLHREDWIPPFRNLKGVNVANVGIANHPVLPAISGSSSICEKRIMS